MNRFGLSVSAFVFFAWSAQAATLYTATLNGATEVPVAQGFNIPQSWSLLGEAMALPATPKAGAVPARKIS